MERAGWRGRAAMAVRHGAHPLPQTRGPRAALREGPVLTAPPAALPPFLVFIVVNKPE